MLSVNLADRKADPIGAERRLQENEGLCREIKEAKNRINNQKRWDVAKKYTNEFEYIFSFNNEGVADMVPISRSFFKIVEIVHETGVLRALPSSIRIACLCEGPGGFVQGMRYACGSANVEVEHAYAITLVSADKKVPNWKLENDARTTLVTGPGHTGDIYCVDTIDDFVSRSGENLSDVVTADGGFDFSADFNSQGQSFVRLLACEIYAGVRLQRLGGHFVMKVFDLFNADTVRLLALLCDLYSTVRVHKPNTSRPANSERYVVCSGYIGAPPEVLETLRQYVVSYTEGALPVLDGVVSEARMHNTFQHVHELNKTHVHKQKRYIERTLELIKESRIFDKRRYDMYCIAWCKRYGIPVKLCYDHLATLG